MEKWCILPDNLVKELIREDNRVLYSLSRFCACTKEELLDIFQKRSESDEHLGYGYKIRRQKIGSKIRPIRIPYDKLKKAQEIIKNRLSYIPVSLSATWGKPWDSVEKNTDIHRHNPYLITLDIKDAYPSIDTHRVYKKLQWAMTKSLKFWCPLLETDEEKDLFIRAVTHLCVAQDQLPQWASTSNQIQNIVMSLFDTKIEKKIPELSWSHIVYSRYADDMTISFPHFSTMDVLKEKMENYIKRMSTEHTYVERPKKKLSPIQEMELGFKSMELHEQNKKTHKENLSAMLNDFDNDTFIVTDRFEISYVQEKIQRMRFLIEVDFDLKWDEKTELIGRLDTFRKNIKFSGRRIEHIQKEIIKIIWSDGRKINQKKIKTRTPQSNTDREINGMTFDRKGNRGLAVKKKTRYLRMFDDLIKCGVNDLFNNTFYREKFKIEYGSDNCVSSIISTINGCYNYITSVYGKWNVPKDLENGYQRAVKKRMENPQIEHTKELLSPWNTGDIWNNIPDDLPF